MISHELSLIQERSADRAMIEAATAEFLRRSEIQVLGIIVNRDIALNDFNTFSAFEERTTVRERLAKEQFDKAKSSIALRPDTPKARKRSKGPTVREKIKQEKSARVASKEASRAELLAKVSELAKGMTKAQVARALGITVDQLRGLCTHHQIHFGLVKSKSKVPKEQYALRAEELKACLDAGMNRSQARAKMGIGTPVLNRIIDASGMTYPRDLPALKAKDKL